MSFWLVERAHWLEEPFCYGEQTLFAMAEWHHWKRRIRGWSLISQVNKSWWLIAIHWLILANDSHFYFFYSFPFLLVTAKLSLRRHQNCNDTKRYKYQIKLKIIWIDELNKMLVLIKCFFKNVNLSTEGLRSYAVWLVDPPFQLLATCTRCYQWSSSWFFFLGLIILKGII
jgi:hypothetical protein